MAAAMKLPGLPVVESGIRVKPKLALLGETPEEIEWLDDDFLIEEERVDFEAVMTEVSRASLPPLHAVTLVASPPSHPSWALAVVLACASLMTGFALALALG